MMGRGVGQGGEGEGMEMGGRGKQERKETAGRGCFKGHPMPLGPNTLSLSSGSLLMRRVNAGNP